MAVIAETMWFFDDKVEGHDFNFLTNVLTVFSIRWIK